MKHTDSVRFVRHDKRPMAAILAVVVATSQIACVRTLPAPSVPAQVTPKLEEEAPEAQRGEGVVVLDTEGTKSRVTLIEGAIESQGYAAGYSVHAFAVATRPLCDHTPCAVALSQGEHRVAFQAIDDPQRASVANVQVRREPIAVRHALGQQRSSGGVGVLGSVLATMGFLSALTGGILWGVAGDSSPGLRSTGQTMTGAGAAGMGVGLTMFFLDRPTQQEGSTVQWRIGPKAPASSVMSSL